MTEFYFWVNYLFNWGPLIFPDISWTLLNIRERCGSIKGTISSGRLFLWQTERSVQWITQHHMNPKQLLRIPGLRSV